MKHMNRLICGHFENMKVPEIGHNIKLSILDPPDNEGRAYDGYNDKLPEDYYKCLLRAWIDKACFVTDGPVFISIAEKWVGEIEHLIRTNKTRLIRRIYWHYNFGQNNKKSYSPCVRPIYWLNRGFIYPEEIYVPSARQQKYGDKRANAKGKMPSNLWEFPRVCGTFKERRSWHPTQFPEALIKRIILGHSQPGDTVLDPFIGSGTAAIVCQETGRNCVGIDQSQYYLDMIKKELGKRHRNKVLVENTKGK